DKRCALTPNLISVMASRVGRKKRWSEDMQARFPEGTFARIGAVMQADEDHRLRARCRRARDQAPRAEGAAKATTAKAVRRLAGRNQTFRPAPKPSAGLVQRGLTARLARRTRSPDSQ